MTIYKKGLVVSFLLTFFYVLGWRFASIIDLSFLASMVLIVKERKSLYGLILLKNGFLLSVLVFLFLAFYVFFTTDWTDASLIARAIRVPIGILGGVALACHFTKKKYSNFSSLLILLSVISCNAAWVILMNYSPTVRDFIYSVTGSLNVLNDTATIAGGVRNPGLTYGLSQTSVFQSIAVLMAAVLLVVYRVKLYTCIVIYLMIAINIFACFFIGRSGLVLSLLFFIVFYLALSISRPKHFLVVSAILVLIVGFTTFSDMPDYSDSIKVQIERAYEVVDIAKGDETNTITNLKNMYFLPDGMALIYGGKGMGRNEYYYTHSDVGYVRVIYAIGIVGLFPYVVFYIYMLLSVRLVRSEVLVIFFVITVLYFLFSVKELFFYSRNVWSVYCLLYGLLLNKNWQRKVR